MKHRGTIVCLALCALLSGGVVTAASGSDEQRIVVPLTDPGRPVVLDVDFMAGQIEVTGYDGRDVVIVARNSTAQYESDEHDGGDDDPGTRSMKRIPNTALGLEIEERQNHVSVSGEWQNYTVTVQIQVPFRTSASIHTVNGGDIVVRDIQGELELDNTNGGIAATNIKGSVLAHTTNGNVSVTFDELTPDKPMSFTSFNGNVDVSFPPSLKADLRIEPGRGDILTDFDFQLIPTAPKIERNERKGGSRIEIGQDVQAKIGGGGPIFHFKTFNGGIYIRKSSGSKSR